MKRRQAGRGLVLGVSLLALLGFGCTPQATPPPETPPSATFTPTETAQEREERVAYEAAEKSYRAARKEFGRLTAKGGSNSATPALKESAAGPYLEELTKIITAYREVGYRTRGQEDIGFVRPKGYASNSLVLDVCEDDSTVSLYNSNNRKLSTSDILVLEIEVRNLDGSWKVWSGRGEKVKSC